MDDKNGKVATGAPLWHGRFDSAPDLALMAMSESLSFDRRLWWADIEGSRAHVRMLAKQGLVSVGDTDAILSALDTVFDEFDSDSFIFVDTDEDIHTAIERRVTQIAGSSGARLHTGRSRNDQVATAMRIWCRAECSTIANSVLALIEELAGRADESDAHGDPLRLPGYTHLQHAQPVLLSHHLRAHCFALSRDVDRILASRERLNVSPLGAGALAGSSLSLDPAMTAHELGFREEFANSLDAVSDRDFVAEILFDVALLGVHLSRIGEEWVLWTSSEFGFVTLDDSVSTGSSMLPQKKNADIAELARGKTGRFVGNLTGLLTMLKGLPLAYNRDLQEDKEPLFDSCLQVRLVLDAVRTMVSRSTFNSQRMASGADSEALVATDVAEWLVSRGMPFRESHALIGALVRRSLESGESLESLVRIDPRLGPVAADLFERGSAITRRSSPGSSGPVAAPAQRERLQAELDGHRRRLDT